jgi:hypothetical protein
VDKILTEADMRCFQAVKTDSASNKSNITLFFTGAHSLEVCKDNAIGISETKPKGLFLRGGFYTAAHRLPPILKTRHFIYVQAAL